jgi:hypothetical protein
MGTGNYFQTSSDFFVNAWTVDKFGFNVSKSKVQHFTGVFSSLVVTMQPGPVLQKGKQVDTEVRWFALANSSSIKVRCRIITVSDANELQLGRKQCGQL